MLLYIAIGVGVFLVLLVAFIASRPSELHVERTAVVHAPADVVHGVINDLRQWGRWSPYDSRDPNMKKTYDGPAAGPGAMYLWNGNSQVGEGKLTILESKPGELVKMRLQMGRPFTCDNLP